MGRILILPDLESNIKLMLSTGLSEHASVAS
jgi:hypothetical protein